MKSAGNVLVTGCSTGIGKATALHLDKLGFQVFASVRRDGDAQALCAEGSERLTPIMMDVSDGKSIAAAASQVRHVVGEGGLRGLVNNAGVAFHSSLEFASLDDLRWLFEVNFFGALAVTQAFLPLIRKARGRVVNISSASELVPAPFHAPYTMAKLALGGLTNALRLELGPFGVQVSSIIAGSIDTPIWERAYELSETITGRQPPEAETLYGRRERIFREYMAALGRRGIDPQQVARVIARALTDRRARHTYWVGVDPIMGLYYWLRDLMPDPLKEWIVLHNIGLA